LSRYCRSGDVVFGATVSGRPVDVLSDAERMVGLFINTLPVRVRIDHEEGVEDWLRRLQIRQIEARRYEHSALPEIQQCSELPSGVPFFDSLLVFENYPVDEALKAR